MSINARVTGHIATYVLVLFVGIFLMGCATAGQQTPDVGINADDVEQQLQQLRTAIESQTQENYSDLAPQVEQLRQALERAYQNGDMSESWQEIEPQLETLEQQLRDGSTDALATLDAVIEQMRADLQQQ